MPKTIHAVFENGMFRPTEPVDLPDPCAVELELRAVDQQPQQTTAAPPVQPGRRVTWDEVFANKLIIGSAPPDQNDDDLELTGDDYLF